MFPGMERNVAQTTTFGQLLGAQPVAEREAIRQIEKCNQKLNNAEVALAFNLVCLKENIYVYIYIYMLQGV